jgi:hypothetical protein
MLFFLSSEVTPGSEGSGQLWWDFKVVAFLILPWLLGITVEMRPPWKVANKPMSYSQPREDTMELLLVCLKWLKQCILPICRLTFFKGLNLNRWMDVFYFFAKLLSRRVVFVNDPWIVRGCSQKEDKRVPWPYGFGNCWGRIWWCHHHILIPDSDIQIYLSLNWLNYLIKIKFHFWEIDENNQPWPS